MVWSSANHISCSISLQSRTLVTHLFKRRNLPTEDEDLVEQLKSIPFIPPAKMNPMLQKIAPQVGSEDVLEAYIPFEVSVLLIFLDFCLVHWFRRKKTSA